jgi:hypothetical protein
MQVFGCKRVDVNVIIIWIISDSKETNVFGCKRVDVNVIIIWIKRNYNLDYFKQQRNKNVLRCC